jgi:hypothetical protein
MRKGLNWIEGLRMAAFMAAIQFLIAAGSYLTGCAIVGRYPCGLEHGARWILAHPLFPDLAPKMILMGFVAGLFFPTAAAADLAADELSTRESTSFSASRRASMWRLPIVLVIIPFLVWALWEPTYRLLEASRAAAPQ